ncbi:MAG: peptidoglycan DD-metalloendopeptidase family protein [Saprospiraceae bacterium]|nr:peptidoglycan DD-metalloendopeptidase family protein [Saprospiraceae bacterium]
MEEKKKKEDLYRLVVFSERTFEEVRSFQFRNWYIWAALSLISFMIIAIVLGILSLKPIKALMSEGDAYVDSAELLALREKITTLEKAASAQQLYINNLRQVLSGEVIMEADSLENKVLEDSVVSVAKVSEDEVLRQMVNLDEQLSSIVRDGQEALSSPKALEQIFLIPPLTGSISMGFNPQKNHLGCDINAPPNTPIKAVMSGNIIYAGWTLETGNTVGIQHDNNLISFYKHNSALLKKTGSFVRAGEAVAIIGNTGTLSSGPHLHFELWSNGKPVNPVNYINFQ